MVCIITAVYRGVNSAMPYPRQNDQGLMLETELRLDSLRRAI